MTYNPETHLAIGNRPGSYFVALLCPLAQPPVRTFFDTTVCNVKIIKDYMAVFTTVMSLLRVYGNFRLIRTSRSESKIRSVA